jgi:electron transport complex protein RnfE
MKTKPSKWKIFINGVFKENPVLILLLGCCSVLAISVTVSGAVGMGAALTFVLVGSNVVISLLRKIIPDKIRIPCFIVVIATFVTLVQMLVEAFLPSLHKALGVFLPLIVVNCIVLGRAEMFASKNTVFDSLLDGLGMGVGYTIVIGGIAVVRELVGSGTLLGARIIPEGYQIGIITQTPGGFFCFAAAMAILIFCLGKRGRQFDPRIGCDGECGNCNISCDNRTEPVAVAAAAADATEAPAGDAPDAAESDKKEVAAE